MWIPPNNLDGMYNHPVQKEIRESDLSAVEKVYRTIVLHDWISGPSIEYCLDLDARVVGPAVGQLERERRIYWDMGSRYCPVKNREDTNDAEPR